MGINNDLMNRGWLIEYGLEYRMWRYKIID